MHYIRRHNIQYLYHMTNIHNLENIMEYGLLSHEDAHYCGLALRDISNQSVQVRRSSKLIMGIPLHRYVCFYFSPRNPMLYTLKDHQQDIVFIGVSPQLLLYPDTVFSDGNAASNDTVFYMNTSSLDYLPWNIINSVYWNDHADGKRIKCAEILVPARVAIQNIIKFFFYNIEQFNTVRELLPPNIESEIKPQIYF